MKLRYLSDVVTLEYDASRCQGCGNCVDVCPHGVFVMEEGKARLVDRNGCIECGACRRNCPAGAIKVQAGVGCAAAVLGSLGKKPKGSKGCC